MDLPVTAWPRGTNRALVLVVHATAAMLALSFEHHSKGAACHSNAECSYLIAEIKAAPPRRAPLEDRRNTLSIRACRPSAMLEAKSAPLAQPTEPIRGCNALKNPCQPRWQGPRCASCKPASSSTPATVPA